MYQEKDYLMLSGIQHFEFCRRQWALIHIEQQWAENYRTTTGELLHKRAHDESLVEKRGTLMVMRGLRIASQYLGVSGQCDVVEFHSSSYGIKINGYEGLWNVIPVEYKRGMPKEGVEDKVQLCAQAMCLEEMLLTEIPKGYIYYGEKRRREEIVLSEELRKCTKELSDEMHELFDRGYTPKVRTSKKCNACSLKDICMPKLNKSYNVKQYIDNFME